MKRILINSSYGNELRVALVDGAKLYDFDTESPDKTLLKGSIFKATVSRVESSLDAAFVNFGSERHGFLPLKDLSSEFYKKDKKVIKYLNETEIDKLFNLDQHFVHVDHIFQRVFD